MSVASSSGSTSAVAEQKAELLRRLDAILGETMPPLIVQAWEGFRRDLPDLLRDHAGRWVAYHGDRRIALGRDSISVYQECLGRGLRRSEFLVFLVEPETDELEVIELPFDV